LWRRRNCFRIPT